MLEIEKKYRLSETRLAEIKASLADVGATFVGEDFEENIIYGGEALDESGGVIRIRQTQDRTLLTFKRRVNDQSDAKQQLEHETEISDAEAVAGIITELGLRPKLVYEKRRKIWKLRDAEVVLDELPFGLFMEIEGSVTAIKEAEMLLGVEDLETEHETYPRLTASLGTQVGDMIEARFD